MQHDGACGWDGKPRSKRASSPPGATASHLSRQSSQCPHSCGARSGFSECKMASCFAEKLPRVVSLPPPGGQRRAWSWAPRLAGAGAHAVRLVGTQPAGMPRGHNLVFRQIAPGGRQGFYPANQLAESNQVLRTECVTKCFRDITHLLVPFWKGRKPTKETRKTA